MFDPVEAVLLVIDDIYALTLTNNISSPNFNRLQRHLFDRVITILTDNPTINTIRESILFLWENRFNNHSNFLI